MVEASTSNRTHHKQQKPTRSEPSERTKGDKCKMHFYSFTSVSVLPVLTLTDTEILLPQWGQLTEAAPTDGAANSSVIGTFNAVAIFSSNERDVFPLFTRVSVISVTPKTFARPFCVMPLALQISLSLISIYF